MTPSPENTSGNPGPEKQTSLNGAGPGLYEQVTTIFIEPANLFRKLRSFPVWVGAFLLILGVNVLATICWAIKVDPEAATVRKMEVVARAFSVAIPQQAIDQAAESATQGGKFYINSFIGVGLGFLVGSLILSLLLLFLVKNGSQGKDIGFKHVWSVSVVHGLALLPVSVLGGAMCLIRGTSTASSFMNFAPTTPAFFLAPANPWLRGFLSTLDPFYLYSFVTLYLAARHALKLKAWAMWVLLLSCGVVGVALRTFAGMF
jgi:hypothetical protein